MITSKKLEDLINKNNIINAILSHQEYDKTEIKEIIKETYTSFVIELYSKSYDDIIKLQKQIVKEYKNLIIKDNIDKLIPGLVRDIKINELLK